jgi:hypothetical protein
VGKTIEMQNTVPESVVDCITRQSIQQTNLDKQDESQPKARSGSTAQAQGESLSSAQHSIGFASLALDQTKRAYPLQELHLICMAKQL